MSKRAYFPALDGLRFVAFMFVFLSHVTFYLKGDFYKNGFWVFWRNNGWIGVDIFFVLTGFLITLLLLEERRVYKKFSISNFWLRRILRIWPLYFLALFVGYFVAPFVFSSLAHVNYSADNVKSLPWYLVFLGNWNVVLHGWGNLRAISQLWVISVDQQFYILWPLLLVFVKTFKKSLIFGFLIIASSVFLRFILVHAGVEHPGVYTNTFARLDTFVVGAILAQILFYKPSFLDKFARFYSGFFQIVAVLVLIVFLNFATLKNGLAIRNGVFGYLIVDIFCVYIILCLLKTSGILVKVLSHKFIRYLGKISYGLYVWHILALEITFYLILPKQDFLVPIFALPLAVLLGFASYQFFEKPFLALKSRLSG